MRISEMRTSKEEGKYQRWYCMMRMDMRVEADHL
jgi:hypothetical protein